MGRNVEFYLIRAAAAAYGNKSVPGNLQPDADH
jgi:hypothetical protein